MDRAISTTATEDDYRQFFIAGLSERFEKADPQLRALSKKFLESLDQMLELVRLAPPLGGGAKR
jgi:hypothetical protein